MNSIDLNFKWTVRPESMDVSGEPGLRKVVGETDGWISAAVAGEVHLDLMNAGLMPEPAIGNNAPDCRWPETKSWWYRVKFAAGGEFLREEQQELVFDGLDLAGQVFLNGRLIGESKDAFLPAIFDIKGLLNIESNELVVRLTAGTELVPEDRRPGQATPEPKPRAAMDGTIPNPQKTGNLLSHRGWHGKRWLRKAQFMYGWDWAEALANIGIWRRVHLEGRSYAILADLRLDTVIEAGRVCLEMEAVPENIHPYAERTCTLELTITPPGGKAVIGRSYALDLPPGRMPARDKIEIPAAELWWPNGMGQQPLYRVEARLTDHAGNTCDRRAFNLGLRTVALDRRRLPEGSRFCIKVNGADVFCRGGNIGPFDVIPARVSGAKYDALVAEAKNANMNMLRINGCSIYESEAFYDACDREGLMVWQDFMMTCDTYPDHDEPFSLLLRQEVEAVVKQLRPHPCIVLWCGNNECQQVFDIFSPDKTKPIDIGGHLFYNRLFPDICRHLDPRRPYWPGSPCGGDIADSVLSGDSHWWYTAYFSKDMDRRIRPEVFDECRARFVSEYGIIAPCHLESLQEYLKPEEMNPSSTAWQVHTNMCEWGTVAAGIGLHYVNPEGLPLAEYIRYGQMFQAMMHGHAMEAIRFRKNDPSDDCQGALIWSYSDCWGETGWSILDYYLRRKASYYWFKRACKPVKVIVRKRRDRLVTRLVNDTLQPVTGIMEAGWWRVDGSAKETGVFPAAVQANGMTEVASAEIAAETIRNTSEWVYAAVLRHSDGSLMDQSILVLHPYRRMKLQKPEIKVLQKKDGSLEISGAMLCHAVYTEDHGKELISDNWFDLLPGVPVGVKLAAGRTIEDVALDAYQATDR
jgi:beta-mannosidase